jgi:hypothetical protein
MSSWPQGADDFVDEVFPDEPPLAVRIVRAIWVHAREVWAKCSDCMSAHQNWPIAIAPAIHATPHREPQPRKIASHRQNDRE